ncbi:hypothetical protein ABKS41_12650 [Enterobacter cloacae]
MIIVISELKGWIAKVNSGLAIPRKVSIHKLPVSFIESSLKNSCILQSTILLFRGGEMLLVVFQYQKTMENVGKRGGASMSPGSNEPDGSNAPYYDDVISFTVVNDQAFY